MSVLPMQYIGGKPPAGAFAGTGPWVPILGAASLLTITTTGTGVITAGTLLIEETDSLEDGVGATPSQLSTLDCTTVAAGKKNISHLGPGAYGYIRARLSVAITGGGQIWVSLSGA